MLPRKKWDKANLEDLMGSCDEEKHFYIKGVNVGGACTMETGEWVCWPKGRIALLKSWSSSRQEA